MEQGGSEGRARRARGVVSGHSRRAAQLAVPFPLYEGLQGTSVAARGSRLPGEGGAFVWARTGRRPTLERLPCPRPGPPRSPRQLQRPAPAGPRPRGSPRSPGRQVLAAAARQPSGLRVPRGRVSALEGSQAGLAGTLRRRLGKMTPGSPRRAA